MWKKKSGKKTMDGNDTPLFNALHKEKEVGTPKMGGIVIWASTFISVALIWFIAHLFPTDILSKLDFLSRNQTWIPLVTLILGALIGLIDDLMEVRGSGDHVAGGLSLKKRLLFVSVISLLCALWFYFKLDVVSIGMPLIGDVFIGWLFVPFFVIISLAIYSGGVIDGIDGLSGGVFASIFAAYGTIAFFQDQINLAAFCAALVGGILAFLWFNIPPARFYMAETGSMALTITLTVVAFMTDSLGGGYGLLMLPIIAFPLILTSFSVLIQILSKKLRGGKKIFLIAPLHHHFEAIGWSAPKVAMRYWIMSIIFAVVGVVVGLIG